MNTKAFTVTRVRMKIDHFRHALSRIRYLNVSTMVKYKYKVIQRGKTEECTL